MDNMDWDMTISAATGFTAGDLYEAIKKRLTDECWQSSKMSKSEKEYLEYCFWSPKSGKPCPPKPAGIT